MLTQLEKADLALRLARLAKRPYNKHAGICANVIFAGTPLATVSHNKYFWWLMDTAARWPNYAGSILFPVKTRA